MFRVIHPFHPLYGRQFQLIIRKHNWGMDRVFFYDDEGKLNLLPTAWTDTLPPDPVVAVSAGRSAFRLRDLVELSDLIKTLQAKGHDK